MRACGVFVLICIAASIATSEAVPCDEIKDTTWYSLGTRKTCFMESTAINSKNFTITSDRDETVEAFNAMFNKNIQHLPNNLGAKFPNLLALACEACAIKEISKDNFKGISKLRILYLSRNQIEKIDDDTFEHIPAVEKIDLADNMIKKLNGRAFASLHKLTMVKLTRNECINEDFYGAERNAEIPRIAMEKCGFNASEPSLTTTVNDSEADLMAQSEELQALKLENVMLRIDKAQADLQIVLNEVQVQFNEVKGQLMLKETCDARIELKVQENAHLSNDLEAKTAEINDKKEKIKKLEKKIQDLGGDAHGHIRN